MSKRRKPVYRNWWVWLIVIVAVVVIYLFASGERIPEEEIQRDGAFNQMIEERLVVSEFVYEDGVV